MKDRQHGADAATDGDSDDAEALGEDVMLAEAVALRLRGEPERVTDQADRDGDPLALQYGGHQIVAVEVHALNTDRPLRKLRKVSHGCSWSVWRTATIARMSQGVKLVWWQSATLDTPYGISYVA